MAWLRASCIALLLLMALSQSTSASGCTVTGPSTPIAGNTYTWAWNCSTGSTPMFIELDAATPSGFWAGVDISSGDNGITCGGNTGFSTLPLSGSCTTILSPLVDSNSVGSGYTWTLWDTNFNVLANSSSVNQSDVNNLASCQGCVSGNVVPIGNNSSNNNCTISNALFNTICSASNELSSDLPVVAGGSSIIGGGIFALKFGIKLLSRFVR